MSEGKSRKKFVLAAVAGLVVMGAVIAVLKFRAIDDASSIAAADIEGQLADLDPLTRAATVEKLAKDNV